MAFLRSSYTLILEQTTEFLLFPHSLSRCRPWTHMLLPPRLIRLALFPNVNAIFAIRECCNRISISLKEMTGHFYSSRTSSSLLLQQSWRMEELLFLSLTTFQISSQSLLETSPLFHCGHISYFCFSMASSLSVHGRPMLLCSVSVPFLPFFRPLIIILAEDFYKKLKANLKPQGKQTKKS